MSSSDVPEQEVTMPLPDGLPEGVALHVRSFTDLMPGVPWTRRLMEELHDSMKEGAFYNKVAIPGYHLVTTQILRNEKRRKKNEPPEFELSAEIRVYSGTLNSRTQSTSSSQIPRRASSRRSSTSRRR